MLPIESCEVSTKRAINDLIEIFLPEVDKLQEKEDLYSVLWDFGGQITMQHTRSFLL